MKTETDILKCFAEAITKRILLKTIRDLRAIKDILSSGESDLGNAWEEICVQLQDEESVFWEVYEEQAEIIIGHHIDALKIHEFVTLWLQTAEGENWIINSGPYVTREYFEQMSEAEKADNRCWGDDDIPALYEDILEYIRGALYRQAMEYSNHRIRKFIENRE